MGAISQSLMARTQQLAEKLLKQGMLTNPKEGVAYTLAVARLMDTKESPTHSQVIGDTAAQDLKHEADYLHRDSSIWQMFWQLYCLQRIATKDQAKIFESDYVSLVV